MAKPGTKDKEPDLREMWVCEKCGKPYVCKDPPDSCSCGNKFFENMHDTFNGKS